MPDAANDIILGWKFTYSLTENIDCDQTLHNMEDVEFVTNVDYREINTITGFKIMTHV